MRMPDGWKGRVRVPAIAAPMFLVSNPKLATACCKAGVDGLIPVAAGAGGHAGQGVGAIRDVPPAGELCARLIHEYRETCRGLAAAA